MLRQTFSFFIFLVFLNVSLGQRMHLLMDQVGEGATFSIENGQSNQVTKASFLPSDQRITVRPRSGIETMSAGYQFRFGADTRFTLTEKGIDLHEGSVMLQSRKIGNQVLFKSPEAVVNISGIGTCMLEVETNGGMKVVGVLGRLLIGWGEDGNTEELLAGELIFVKPGNSGFGDKINVNLGKVVETSFLLSGFQNSSSFNNSLSSVVKAQLESIGKTYRAEVGDAKGVDTFEVVTFQEEENEEEINVTEIPEPAEKVPTEYNVPNTDPLHELLGRAPSRMNEEVKTDQPSQNKPRPLPGSLLRKKN